MKRSKADLSIVAVVIDNLEVTQRFISSIRQYTSGSYELILIDNNSKNKKAISYYKKSADRYFRFETITSLAKAWNKGIELSQGKFIAVTNNDVVVPPDWFEPLRETLMKNKKAGMVSPLTYWLIQGFFKYKILKNWNKDFVNPKPFKLQKFKEMVWGEFCVFRREALGAVGGYNEIYKKLHSEDLEIVFQLFDHGYDVYVDPRVFVYHEGGATYKANVRSQKELDKIQKENFELFMSRWPKYTKGWK